MKPYDLVLVSDAPCILLIVIAFSEPRNGACLHYLAKFLELRHDA